MKIAILGGTKIYKDLKNLFVKDVEISFFLDNNPQLLGKKIDNKKIYSPYGFPKNTVDYIIVFIYEYKAINQELIDLGIEAEEIINFASLDLTECEHDNLFNIDVADRLQLLLKIDYMEKKVIQLENSQQYFEQNYAYEMTSKLEKGSIRLPTICSVKNTCEKIISDKCSMSRYGDGEFEIIFGHAKDVYQNNNKKLAERLQDILKSNLKNHIVALADDYGSIEEIRKENRNTIRRYMTKEKRQEHYQMLDMEKTYYNAYISRPYVIYPHDESEKARARFDDLKRIWDKQEVLFIEGNKTRMGVGNDLFCNAKSIKRIIAPNENAFDVYDEIYRVAVDYGKDQLILIALGPTATVLAYDLAKIGYWALDIGHLDLEYEWFLKGNGYSYIPHKYNNEMLGDTVVTELLDFDYSQSILKVIDRS